MVLIIFNTLRFLFHLNFWYFYNLGHCLKQLVYYDDFFWKKIYRWALDNFLSWICYLLPKYRANFSFLKISHKCFECYNDYIFDYSCMLNCNQNSFGTPVTFQFAVNSEDLLPLPITRPSKVSVRPCTTHRVNN